MDQENPYRAEQILALQEIQNVKQHIAALDDTLRSWMECYLDLLIRPIRDEDITAKITRHLTRFSRFFSERYGHDHISTCLKRDVVAWQNSLEEDLAMAPATVNNHVASLSGFMIWVDEQDEHRFPAGNPCKGLSQLPLPPLEPRALTKMQVASLKNLCDRLPRLYERKGQRYQQRRRKHPEAPPEVHRHSCPWRDRAIVYFLLATGVRREELIRLNLEQVQPHTLAALRNTQIVKILAMCTGREGLEGISTSPLMPGLPLQTILSMSEPQMLLNFPSLWRFSCAPPMSTFLLSQRMMSAMVVLPSIRSVIL